jgi:DNA-binding NtrC family response regulator
LPKQSKILVIDDDFSIREVLSMLLEEEGYIVDTAEDGKEAIEKSNNTFYNLAIIDYRLPDIEGTLLLKKLRDTTPKMIKVMLTGYPSTKNAIDAVNNNAHAFLQKPVETKVLLAKISELLKMQQEEAAYSEERVADFIRTKMTELKGPLMVEQSLV